MEGILNQVSVGKETTYGTAVAPTVSIPVRPSDGIQPQHDVVGVEAINTTAPKNKSLFGGIVNYNGGFEADLYPTSIALILLSALGASSPAQVGGETLVYKHTFTEAVAKTGLTVEQKVGDLIKRYAGFIASRITIGGKVGEAISFSFEGGAKAEADATAITPVYETTRPFNFADVATLSIAGTDIKAKVSEFEFEYKNGLDFFHGLGSVDPQDKYVGQSELTGKISLLMDATTKDYFEDLLATTEQAIILDIVGDAIGVASHYEFKLTIPKAAISTFASKLDFGYNAIDLEFVAREDATDGLLKAELTNLLATI